MAGAPVRAPGIADRPTITLPSTVPTTVAAMAAVIDSCGTFGGCSTVNAPANPSRLTPRLAHNAPWSVKPRIFGVGPSRVGATSVGCSTRDCVAVITRLPTPALPGQVQAVDGATSRPLSPVAQAPAIDMSGPRYATTQHGRCEMALRRHGPAAAVSSSSE